jgi:DNA polymerase-1
MHHANFDLAFLNAMGFVSSAPISCTLLLSRMIRGPGWAEKTAGKKGKKPPLFHSLGEVAKRELGVALPKELQLSDWAAPKLTAEQLAYAANDAAVLLPLYAGLTTKIVAAGMEAIAAVESRCIPAWSWLTGSGVAFDSEAWRPLVEDAQRHQADLTKQLDALAPPPPEGGTWNWRSWQQVLQVFHLLGFTHLKSTGDEVLATVDHPLAKLLRKQRSADQLVKTYGMPYFEHVHEGRIYAGWNQLGAVTGRTSCREPNLQNIPAVKKDGDPNYRACFVAPPGRVLIKADYNQLQLRIAAKVANEPKMIDAFVRGEDLHSKTARAVFRVVEPTKEQRKLSKALNFGLLFGLTPKGYREDLKTKSGIDLTPRQAMDHYQAFFKEYTGVARWHRQVRKEHAAETRTLLGRRRLFRPNEPDTERFNAPVQGTDADGLKLALALLWERRSQCPGAFPVLAVHDELVIECDASQAEAVKVWLHDAMMDGMAYLLAPVPCVVDVSEAAHSWGG